MVKTVRVTLNDDISAEALENFTLNLSGAVNATIGNATASATIIDNDSPAPAAPIAINGTTGNDVLKGTQFADALTGNAGNDVLAGDNGNDSMAGGTGNDIYIIENTGDTYTEAVNSGTDLVVSYLSTITLGANVENLRLAGTAVTGIGNALNNTITGNTGANTIIGGLGNDILNGGVGIDTLSYASATAGVTVNLGLAVQQNTVNAGLDTLSNFENLTGSNFNDTLTGNTGANVINGGLGVDSMTGGNGNDTYVVDNIGDTVVEGIGLGTDNIQSSVTYTLATNVENLTLTGALAINGSGNGLSNVITGNNAANTLNGGIGVDTLFGKAGNDILTGGAGADSFVFDTALNAATNNDTITDFSVVDDTIRLENAIFNNFTTPGALAAGSFVSGAGAIALDSNDFLVYNTTDGSLYYDADGSGAGARVEIVSLTGIPALTAADFVIV